jgi:hypothetical protein
MRRITNGLGSKPCWLTSPLEKKRLSNCWLKTGTLAACWGKPTQSNDINFIMTTKFYEFLHVSEMVETVFGLSVLLLFVAEVFVLRGELWTEIATIK